MKRHVFILLLAAAALSTLPVAGEPFPLSATARQRYPWNGRVDVDVTFGGEAGYTYRVGLSAKDMVGGTNLPVRTVWREGATSGGNPVPFTEPGTYRLIWSAASDLPAGFVAESVVVNATLTPVANPYTVRFNKNVAKATGTMADQAFVYDMGQTLSTNAFSLKGYTFSGWATNTTGSVVYGNGQQVWKLTTVSNGVVNLYAKWTPNTFTVTFNANGGTGTMANQTYTYDHAQAIRPNAFSRPGWTFTGWAKGATWSKAYDDQQPVSNITAIPNDTVTLYAVWAPNPYTVRFNKNATAATGTMADQAFVYDMRQTLSTNAFSLKGYTFSGWATNTTGSVVYGNGQQVWKLTTVSNGVVNLYAKWTANTYSVKFNANTTGATGSMANEAFTYGTAKALTANAFAKTGYTFSGWATSATGAKAYNDKQSVSNLTATAGGTVNLYAVWTANTYSVKFNKNATDATGTMSNEAFTYGAAKALTANSFSRTGYTFGGWATSSTGAKAYNDKQSVSNLTATAGATVDLYAVWTANTYSVKFNKNATDATGTMSNEAFTYGVAKALTANAFAKTGYTFAGWSKSATGAKAYNDKQTVSNLTATAGGTVNLYGLWTTNTYTVRFNANGGSGTMANQGFTYNRASALRANAFTRTGYTFGGWAKSASGAKAYNDKQSVSNLTATAGATVDLYAVWTGNAYTVKFNANGGSGSMADQSFRYGTAQALRANAFSRTGYAFAGWATSASGSKVYNNQQSVSNLTTTSGGTVTLYAVWTKALYMVIDLSSGSSSSKYPVSYLTAVPSGGWSDEYKTTKLVLRRINAGTFTMGSPSGEVGRFANETQHSVKLSKDFYIGVFEVTQRQWELVMGTRPSYFSNGTYYSTRPVERVSYNAIRGSSTGAGWPGSSAVDSSSFIGRIRSRTGLSQFDLPTDAQWEYACRAGTTTAVSNGINLNNAEYDYRIDYVCWHYQDYTAASPSSGWGYGTMPVGEYGANPWGLYDMHGNVWEWCLDWYTANLGTSAVTDPKGPSSGSHRVVRSGAWECSSYNCRSARRGDEPPSATKRSDSASDGHFGFRLSITP